jgi:hypothetical protein
MLAQIADSYPFGPPSELADISVALLMIATQLTSRSTYIEYEECHDEVGANLGPDFGCCWIPQDGHRREHYSDTDDHSLISIPV